ncbi:unnamed protein product [Knipowitschia caucasica]
MDTLDEVTVETLRAANIEEDLLWSLSRDDIKDLMPGPENFLRRRALWLLVSKDESVEAAGKKLETSKLSTTSASALPEENPNTNTNQQDFDHLNSRIHCVHRW